MKFRHSDKDVIDSFYTFEAIVIGIEIVLNVLLYFCKGFMKIIVPYILLIGWLCYILAGMQSFASVAINSKKIESCHKTEAKAEKNENCCAKMHRQHPSKEKSGDAEKGEKDDCCGNSNCSRTCCHLAISILLAQERIGTIELFYSQKFPKPQTDQLPDPFIRNISPPPNA